MGRALDFVLEVSQPNCLSVAGRRVDVLSLPASVLPSAEAERDASWESSWDKSFAVVAKNGSKLGLVLWRSR